jgi:uronate dehydrogenase
MASVLVTGSAGAVGRPVCRELLGRGHAVRGLDLVPTPDLDDCVVADIAEPEPVAEAMRGVEAVVHLAAEPNDAPFAAKLVGPNVVGLHNVMSAAREAGVRRVVLASSMMVVLYGPKRGRPARVDEAYPADHYALTKLWAEQMGEMYARCHGLSVIALRLTWMVRNPDGARRLRQTDRRDLYVSSLDAGRAFASAVEATGIEFAVVYAGGPDCGANFDLEPARRLLGFEPRDHWPEGLGFELPPEEE